METQDFSNVLAQIDRFLRPVFEAVIKEDEFFGTWSSQQNVWKKQMTVWAICLRKYLFQKWFGISYASLRKVL